MAQRVLMPRLSQEMDQGTIAEWLKHEGDVVVEGEPLLIIESDKAEVELPAPQSGTVRAILVVAGEEVTVGTVLAVIAAPDEEIDERPAATEGTGIQAPAEAPAAPATVDGTPPPRPATTPALAAIPTATARQGAPAAVGARMPVSPVARRVAAEAGVDVAQITGTGPDGLVTEADVRAFAAVQGQTQARGDVEIIPLTGRRRRAADRLAMSRQTAADVTTVVDVDVTDVAAIRKRSGASYTAFVAWAAAQSLREFPILNASLVGDEIHIRKTIDLGVAVALEQGLVVPVIRTADRKTVEQISTEIDELAALARDEKLGPGELAGSSFTVTNSGAFGSLLFTPIINQPEVAILGMGKVADTPVVRAGEIVARKVMYLCLSYDHRVVDGAAAVQFLGAVKRRLEQVKGQSAQT